MSSSIDRIASQRPRRRGAAASPGRWPHAGRLACVGALAVSALALAQPAAAQYTRASVATDGTQANAASLNGVISANGQFVAFSSLATNLVANDTNGVQDVFVRDLTGNTTTRVSVATGGAQALASSTVAGISDDGNIVLFTSFAPLDGNDARQCTGPYGPENCQDVWIHNRTTGQTTRVSVGPGGVVANNFSANPVMSGDGRFIAFESAATNLVAGDANGKSDIFLRDVVAGSTTLVSLGAGGTQSTANVTNPSLSRDGRTVAFVTEGGAFGEPVDDITCTATAPATCTRAFVRNLNAGTVVRLKPLPNSTLSVGVQAVALSGDAQQIAVSTAYNTPNQGITLETQLFDLTNGQVARTGLAAFSGLAIAGDGNRFVANGGGTFSLSFRQAIGLFDRFTGLTENIPAPPAAASSALTGASLDATARHIVFATAESTLVAGDTNNVEDIFVYDRDRDGDGIPSYWETYFGLDPTNPADAATDSDNDGRTNVQEYLASSHPNAAHTRYFAEGASNAFFATRFAVINPNPAPALVLLRLLGANGAEISTSRTLAPNQRTTFEFGPGTRLPDVVFSTIVESNLPVVADRLMTWDATGYGSTVETSVESPATTWYLAEGATGVFSLYYLLQNPGDTPATVTVTYLRPAPAAPIVKTGYTVAPHSRFTIDVAAEDPGLLAAEVSAKIDSDVPIVVERAMYRTTNGQFLAAGHAGAGLTTAAPRWFLAEGATGFFDEYVLIVNATNSDAQITATFLLEGSASFQDTFTVPANTRQTVDLKRYEQLQATPVSVVIDSTNAVPVTVERVMWWPSGPAPYEASLSAAVTETGTRWAVAEGEQGGPFDSSTYVLVANTDASRVAPLRVTLLFDDGTTFDVPNVEPVPANARRTIDISQVATAANRRFGVVVESLDGVPIVVERSFYSSTGGVLWNAGGTSVATNLTAPPPPPPPPPPPSAGSAAQR